MTEAAPWSDHEIEPGPDSPLAVCNRTWVETVQRVMAAHESSKQLNALLAGALDRDLVGKEQAREWARRWKAVAKRQLIYTNHNFAWGERHQLSARQGWQVAKEQAERGDRLLKERDEARAALTRIRDRCRGATNPNALDAWDIADGALARGRAESG